MSSNKEKSLRPLILTGFAAFNGHAENPSQTLALEFDGQIINNKAIVQSLVLPVSFEHCFQELARELEDLLREKGTTPHSIICLGLNSGAHKFEIEKVALNFQHTQIADNEGQLPKAQKVRQTGPDAYFSSLPVEKIVAELNLRDSAANEFRHNPYELSLSAGSYVCNTLYYRVLDYLKQSCERFPQTHGVFCHVPKRKGNGGTFAQTTQGQNKLLKDLLEKVC